MVSRYSPLRLAFADLCARDTELIALSFERAMADPRWCRVIRQHARRFRPVAGQIG